MATRALPNEQTKVELALIDQLVSMDWSHVQGDDEEPSLTERMSFYEVILRERLRHALRRINIDDGGNPWLDDTRIVKAIDDLERLGATKLMESNEAATRLLLEGTVVEGVPGLDRGRDQTIRFIDFDDWQNNDFFVINQFRVDRPGGVGYILPDIVLFVNGIPVAVIECKSPAATNPMEEGITQLLRYSNQRDWVDEDEGAERLFHYCQVLASTYYYQARAASIGASYEHFLEWKDTSPVPASDVAAALGKDELQSQELLVAGMFRPAHLIDLIRNFVVFDQSSGKTIKIVARYQQFRAVHRALARLASGLTRSQTADGDTRSGVIWHTQGSGKSLSMVFLVRKMRTLSHLRRFKVVVVTDRRDLEKQLSDTATLTGEVVRKATNSARLRQLLAEEGSDLVFAMIQKYQQRDEQSKTKEKPELYSVLNESEEIVVLVDEAHRSQSNELHANLLRAMPNCARIGFTGTPIMLGDRKKTREIFGELIDVYTIKQSEEDGATLPILYEGRTAETAVADGADLDELFEDMFRDRTPKELERLKAKYATKGEVLEAPKLITAKAEDMLRHYVDTVLPNGFKAQLVASSRRAAVRYARTLATARDALVTQVEQVEPSLLTLTGELLEQRSPREQFLVRAHASLDLIRKLEFAAVISHEHNQEADLNEWSDKQKVDSRIARFKRPLEKDTLAFLCVKSMLLTGFDAPVEQVMYLDRPMQGHELLQAIARVNRTATAKEAGFIVDYYGVARHLKEALAVYAHEDVEGVLVSIKDELPTLRDRHARVLKVFSDRGIALDDIDGCVGLLRDERVRADFTVKLKAFLKSLDIVLPRPEALNYTHDARVLGFINKAAANLYRDPQLNLLGAGFKVRRLIHEHIVANGIDPAVAPISILDAQFDEEVEKHATPRAKASEMEHAARYHINVHFAEDPIRYRRLSERLEAIIEDLKDNWDDIVLALKRLADEIREGRSDDRSGLDPRTQVPFLSILLDEASLDDDAADDVLARYAGLTVELVEHVRQEIVTVDFWRNQHAQAVLRGWIVQFLDDNDLVPFDRLQPTADHLVGLAKANHGRLAA